MKMKYILILAFSFLSTSILFSQIMVEKENKTMFSIMPYYQYWGGIDSANIRQYSSRFLLKYFFDRDISLSVQGGYASSDALQNKIDGISDVQLSLNYKFRKLNTALDFGVNLPTGEEGINPDYFTTSVLLAQDVFNMKLPLLGQGTNIFAGLTWAKAISDFIIVGLGTSYQIKGEYYPITDGSILYKPSNELLVTAGLDFRLGNTATLSGDLIEIFYGKDEINNGISLSAGTKSIFSLMFRQFYGYNSLTVFFRYRYSADDKVYGYFDFVYHDKIIPNNFMTFINFKHYMSELFTLQYIAEARFYQKTVAPYSGFNVYGFGIVPNINLSSSLSVPLTMKFYLGNSDEYSSAYGVEIGLGLDVTF